MSGDAEGRYGSEESHDLPPDRLFQRRRALTILGDEFTAPGKADVCTALRPFSRVRIQAGEAPEEVAPALGMPLGTVKNLVFRRRIWRGILFKEVTPPLTDATPEEIKGELAEQLRSV